jgi:hypothetical protein
MIFMAHILLYYIIEVLIFVHRSVNPFFSPTKWYDNLCRAFNGM